MCILFDNNLKTRNVSHRHNYLRYDYSILYLKYPFKSLQADRLIDRFNQREQGQEEGYLKLIDSHR